MYSSPTSQNSYGGRNIKALMKCKATNKSIQQSQLVITEVALIPPGIIVSICTSTRSPKTIPKVHAVSNTPGSREGSWSKENRVMCQDTGPASKRGWLSTEVFKNTVSSTYGMAENVLSTLGQNQGCKERYGWPCWHNKH